MTVKAYKIKVKSYFLKVTTTIKLARSPATLAEVLHPLSSQSGVEINKIDTYSLHIT